MRYPFIQKTIRLSKKIFGTKNLHSSLRQDEILWALEEKTNFLVQIKALGVLVKKLFKIITMKKASNLTKYGLLHWSIFYKCIYAKQIAQWKLQS